MDNQKSSIERIMDQSIGIDLLWIRKSKRNGKIRKVWQRHEYLKNKKVISKDQNGY